ncbi:YceD family protein [Tropicimonas sp. TH_r6]|uniref:YceD family protein n=1 Tax=Tropicimonas sp. TH_r6 TaxID=3082085 RepID=UPI002952E703|nr:YceD family protein [Tropicimonas sp. TH_r6]MDV7144436.1 YceD family protein [Tropicimonas sp. TH_r6]
MNATDSNRRLVLARLSKTEPTPFRLPPEAVDSAGLQRDLELLGLRKLRFEGQLIPVGRNDWRLEATFGATAVQPCAITLAPVTTRIDTKVLRRYSADFTAPTDAEAEMPEDDTLEPLPETVDLVELLTETLALALPDFPRADGAELGEAVFAEPGAEPLTEEAAKPFAGLATLKKSLEGE